MSCLRCPARTKAPCSGARKASAAGAAAGTNHPLRQGSVTNALDPKAPIIFRSLLPRFVPAGGQAMSALTALGRVLPSEPSLR